MDLSNIIANAEDQDRGIWFPLLHPGTGQETGITLLIAGPDSATQARSRIKMVDELAAATGDDGRVSATDRAAIRLNDLARSVLGWEITEDGQPIPFSHANVLRFLKSAPWVQASVDAIASDRRLFLATLN